MKKLVVGIMALGCAVAALSGRAGEPAVKPPEESNAFEKFRQQEIMNFQQYAQDLSKQKGFDPVKGREQMKEYMRKMIGRYEQFRDSADGKPYAFELNNEILSVAVHLLQDDELVDKVVASEKDPERSDRLKLSAAQLYGQLDKKDRAKKLVLDVLAADRKNPELRKQAEILRFQVAPEGLTFPEFPQGAKDLDGKAIKIADYKGKVVLVDFWAAWCQPCVAELPNVLRAYEKYHPKGFEIIGISLDQSKDLLLKTTKEKKMTWRQSFDGLVFRGELPTAYHVQAIPSTYLVGPDGKIVASDLRGEGLDRKLDELLTAAKPEKPKAVPLEPEKVEPKPAPTVSP